MENRDLIIKQIDRKLLNWQLVKEDKRPKVGWVKALRTALGMSRRQLARRLAVSPSRVNRIEEDEQRDAVTLRTLKQAAKALDCELVYAIVPQDSIKNLLEQQARKIAKRHIKRVAQTMALENQSVDENLQNELEEEFVLALLRGPLKKLWEE